MKVACEHQVACEHEYVFIVARKHENKLDIIYIFAHWHENKMKHIKQYRNECWLSTVCMLTDYPYYLIRKKVGSEFKISWSLISCGTDSKWKTACEFVLQQVGLPMDAVPISVDSTPEQITGTEPDLSGRGTIILYNELHHIRHIVAYEDYDIHDPSKEEVVTWKEWYSKMTEEGWTIKLITPLKGGDKKW